MDFKDKVVIITGASSGIGAGAARYLGKLGAKVALVGRSGDRLNGVAQDIIKSGAPSPLIIVADVTKDANRIISETINNFGKIHTLVNNAGIAVLDNLLNFDTEVFNRVMDTNLRAAIHLTTLAVPYLAVTKGSVINISSLSSYRPITSVLSYSVSKAALDQFTKCASLDLAPMGIRVNSVNPGLIHTAMFDAIGMSEVQKERMFEGAQEIYPLGRIGTVDDVAAAIAYLASDLACFITGISMPVDGGRHNVYT